MDHNQAKKSLVSACAALESVIADTSTYLGRHGIHRPSTISPANFVIFMSWPEEKIHKTTSNLRKILNAHLTAELEHVDIDDSASLLRIALRELKMAIDPKFFNEIDRNDVVEVYDNEHIQVFRSFNFFRLSNYNLDDVLSHEWFELYERDAAITKILMDETLTHLKGLNTISIPDAPEHLLRERLSEQKAVFVSKMKRFGTVYSGPEKIPGFVCTLSVKPISDNNQIDFLRSRS